MRKTLWVLFCVATPALAAQQPPGPRDSARAAELRKQVERRFAEHVKRELELTDEQAAKLRATQERFAEQRRAVMKRQRDLRRALQDQMRPGQAADPDSVRKLMDGLQAGRADLLRLEQEADREMAGYLTPVQRARFQMLRERLLDRVQELRRGRDRMDSPRRRPGRMPA